MNTIDSTTGNILPPAARPVSSTWTVSDSMYFEETAGRSVKSFLYTIVQCLQDVQQSIDDLNDSIESMCEGKNES